MRIQFADEEAFPNAAFLFEANRERSLKSRGGQAALRRLEAALLALPEKKLVADVIENAEGMVCGLGALAKHENYQGSLALPTEPSDESTAVEWASWYGQDEYGGKAIEDAMLALAKELNVRSE